MPYRTQSSDTHPIVEKLQFAHLRRMGRKSRFENGLARVDESLNLMWRSFRRSHSHLDEAQLHIEWARVQHGEELANQLEAWLQCPHQKRR